MRLLSPLLLAALALPAAAQEAEIRSANLPHELEWELIRMFDGDATRYDGPATVERMEVVRGDVAVYGGPFRVAGRVMGDLAVVDGDVIIEEGGSVTGSITVVGGQVRMGDGADVGGTITAYATSSRRGDIADRRDRRDRRDRDRDRDRDDDDEWEDVDDDWDDWWSRRREGRWDRGYSRLTVRTGASYNRVEGLPVMFGPVIQTAGSSPFRFEALAIWRTESGATLDTDRLGYQVRAEQFIGGRAFSLGGSAFSLVEPMDRWQISDLEASLATAVFHDDYRDHFGRTGWSAFATVRPFRGLKATAEYRQESFDALAAGDPWSLFHRDDTWRYQPLVAEGDLRTLAGSLELDLRDDDEDPRRGWYGRVAVERPLDGTLTRPELLAVTGTDGGPAMGSYLPAADVDTDFTTAMIDLRRYSLVGWESQLNVRLMAGGSVNESPVPAQFQHALGGIGTLPGFPTFYADCGARTAVGGRGTARFYPSYGCDRFALAQIEYRGDLSLDFGFGDPDYEDEDWWDEIDIDFSPTWVVFFDAGQGWAYEDPALGPDRDTGTLYDVGMGFLIDDLGIYAALPLNGDVDQEPRFFIRLGRRF